MDNYKTTFIKNTFLSVAQRLVTTVTTFLLMPYMILRMGSETYGYWLILQIFSIGGYLSLAEMGFQGSIVRYLTKYHAEKDHLEFKKLYLSGLTLFLALGVICLIIILLFSKYLFLRVFSIPHSYEAELKAGLTAYAFSFVFQFPAIILKAFYTSIQDFFKLKLWETLNVVVFALAVVIVMFFSIRVSTIVIIEAIIQFVFFSIFFIVPLKRYKGIYSLNLKFYSTKSLLSISGMTYYLFFYKIFGLIYNRTPQIVIAYFLAPSFMTYYAIFSKIPRTLKVMQGMINSAVLPLAVSLDTLEQQDKMKYLFLRGTRYSFVLLMPAVIFSYIYAGDILNLWVGADFVFLVYYLRAYLVWHFLNFFISFGSSMYTRTEHFKYMLPYHIAGAAVFLLSSVFLIERYELWAILLGLILSSCIVLPINIFIINRVINFSFAEFFNYVLKSPVIFGSLVCITFLVMIRSCFPAGNMSLLILYASTMYVFYMMIFYRYCIFDTERNDISMILRSYGKRKHN